MEYIHRMSQSTWFTGKLLIAMPHMSDVNFDHSLVLVCAHSEQGAMGVIINKAAPLMSLADLLDETKIAVPPKSAKEEYLGMAVRLGGPVEQFRGFVLHSQDYPADETSLLVGNDYTLTVTLDALRDIAQGKGPQRALVALGYSGWQPGQLENEIQHNGWLHCDADPDLVFHPDLESKYSRALAKLGVDPSMLSTDVGHA
jgi:putative transcriptional regulator